jgi:beta-glucuronidase
MDQPSWKSRVQLRSAAVGLGMIVAVFVLASMPLEAKTVVDLSGDGWTFRTLLDEHRTAVKVPHCWPLMKGYERYIGEAIYERDFDAPSLAPGQIARLQFDAVYYKARVWLNGINLGTHEGGYTPFELEVTKKIKVGRNHLVVEVDNTPTLTTIPAIATAGSGSHKAVTYGELTNEGIFGWMPYGGIVRPVRLVFSKSVYLRNIKIEAKPNLANDTADVTVFAWVRNDGDTAAIGNLTGRVAKLTPSFNRVRIKSHSETEVRWTGMLHGAHLWSVHDPFLYEATLAVNGEEMTASFGVREIRVRGTELLLNGSVVHLFGANRVSEDPAEGLRESDAIIERDLGDMLAANMRMTRIAHYPQAPALLEFADRHGMLIIAEVGNWNMSAWQMADPKVRALWKQQMREMMEQDWNHPSLIAWSLGNEYESATPEGFRWTRDMRSYTLAQDGTRLITFASRFTTDPMVKTGDDEANRYSDFVSVNFYGDYARQLDRVHQLWPDKPVFMTEFGHVGEPGIHDPKRIADITDAVRAMKARPWVVGGSVWTWADYRSLYRGTPPDGIRRWGVVNFERGHRDSWKTAQQLFATELP